ncbi:MAG: sodium/proline symporter [Planctomycetota bacterium]|nr:MAG: sodium/proline symporter [Planctomycetota bacterium]
MKDFFVGGKKLGYWVVAFSARATGESAWLLLGLTGLGALMGMKALWVVVGEVIGVGIAWIIMSRPFKFLTDKYDSVTIPDYLESRFQDKSHLLRTISALALLVFPTIYVSAQLDATGKAFQAFLSWNYFTGMIVGFLVVLVYITFGGFIAVAWSDLVQGVLMLLGLVALPIGGLFFLGDGNPFSGLGIMWNSLHKLPGNLASPLGEGGASLPNIMSILGLVFIGLGYLGSPQIFVRFISLRDKSELSKGTWIAILWTLFADTGAVLAGMAGRVMFDTNGLTGSKLVSLLGKGCENVLPMMADHIFPLIISALYVAIVLAAIMSTLDSLLVLASSAVVRDFYQKIFHPEMTDKEMTSYSRWITFGLSLVGLFLALSVAYFHPKRTIFWFVIFGWSGIAATFCPVILLSLFWKGLTKAGAATAMITGFLGVIIFKFWPLWADKLGYMPNSFGKAIINLEELAPSFFLALLAAIFVSTFTPKPEGVEKDLEEALSSQ